MLKKSCAVALSLVFVLSIVSAIPSFAMENKEPYTTHNYPETVKIGEVFGGLASFGNPTDYGITIHNLTPDAMVAAWGEVSFNAKNITAIHRLDLPFLFEAFQ